MASSAKQPHLARENMRPRATRTASRIYARLTIVAFLLMIFDIYTHPSHRVFSNPGLWVELVFMCGAVVFALLDRSKG
jgi:hypothetical protein